MRTVRHPAFWFASSAVLFAAVLVVGGAAGGVLAALTAAALIVGCFRALNGQKVDDRTAGAGIFGGFFSGGQ